ncbi:TIGR03086 family metal-binding protein [Actinokineospora sp. UTMC 2448]|uniref:TIGR03086 family metal-binding protein n=1 Tax=Actinokineospora sp. UTMC 2448 TaxID=2268449 RepID=UPI002164C853|nr:TIGR03086 family metal-binding protein [Actinokineospora sp. UTMC 2448]UVS78147.1 putative Actinobacterial protein [Actinokineospora sp. UTMC 2448]
MDIRDLDRRAIESTGGIIDKLTDDQLDLPTPCDKWTVRDVIAHMVENNQRTIERLTGAAPQAGDDVRRDYRTSAAALTSAFADDAAMEAPFEMPVIGRTVPGSTALTVHFADVLVHGWDLARAIGADIALDPELVEAAVGIVGQFPDVPELWSDDSNVFKPRLAAGGDADPQERLLALTGRRADWTA